MAYYLAVDIGASGGRHILCHPEDGRIVTEEVYRFDNGAEDKDGHLCWNLRNLEEQLLEGMRACRRLGREPVSMGIDTWGVDYVLLDRAGSPMGDAYAYRDSRTEGMPERLEQKLPFERHYALTGIARQPFNTVYQLMAEPPERLRRAARLLLMPDYLGYLLTGRMACEYTNASTTGLLGAATRDWSGEVLRAADIPAHLFAKPVMPGTVLGPLRSEIASKAGFSCRVVLPATHDTGSAFMAVPAESPRAAYLSSGTWSLFGVLSDHPLTGIDSLRAGFTNEGGYGGFIRYLKNIMGLWMLQCVRRETDKRFSYAEMARMAMDAPDIPWLVDTTDNRFLAPPSMMRQVQQAVSEQGGPELELPQLLRVIHKSLAQGYRRALDQLCELTGQRYDVVHVVGGGSQNATLNQMTADACGLPVIAGPAEGTALGNLMAQMIADGVYEDLAQARRALRDSFPVLRFLPGEKKEE